MSIRVTNKRWDSQRKPEPGEIVVAVDRSSKILGNPFVMRWKNAQERKRVIDEYQAHHTLDFARQGPIYERSVEIAQMLLDGKSVALDCFCAPLPCHGEIIMAGVSRMHDDMKAMAHAADNVYPAGSFLDRVARFAATAHARVLQRRKFTGEPYIVHPIEVAAIVRTVTDDEEMIAAALLHDTVEDTQVSLADIKANFGDNITRMVDELTDVAVPADGNRARRREINRAHSALAAPKTKTVKLADVISNTKSIATHQPDFARVYLPEMRLLMEVLREGDWRLYAKATEAITRAEAMIHEPEGQGVRP